MVIILCLYILAMWLVSGNSASCNGAGSLAIAGLAVDQSIKNDMNDEEAR